MNRRPASISTTCRKLLNVLHRLADLGNTVLVVEHNLDVIKTADWIVDMGPEAGTGGGFVVAVGTPEAVVEFAAAHPESPLHTGRALAPVLAEGPLRGARALRRQESAREETRRPFAR